MLFRAPILLLLGMLGVTLRAQPSLDNARRAQWLLGAGIWSQVIEVKNESRGGVYPETVHALVFELAGILWFYADADGTQSFSLHRGRLAQEKADFKPLLKDIDSGFTRWSVVPEAPPPAFVSGGAPLQNGCFIESVVALRERLLRGARVGEPRLLSYYAVTRRGQVGHTVLAYDVDGRVEVFDPARPEVRLVFPKQTGLDALGLARTLDRRSVTKARYLPVTLSVPVEAVATAVGDARSGGFALDPSRS